VGQVDKSDPNYISKTWVAWGQQVTDHGGIFDVL